MTAVDVVTYSVGDWVWVKRSRGIALTLARVESAVPHRNVGGSVDRWLLRMCLAKGWSAPLDFAIERSLTPSEVAHQRKLGLIPPAKPVNIPMPWGSP